MSCNVRKQRFLRKVLLYVINHAHQPSRCPRLWMDPHTADKDSYKHLENSLKIFKLLEEKVDRFDYAFRDKCVKERDFEALEIYVMELLMGTK